MHYPIVVLCVLFSMHASASDECARALPEPIGIADHPSVASYRLERTDARRIEEFIELKSGRKVSISQYGCAHFGLSYKFSGAEEFNENYISAANELLIEVSDVAPIFTQHLVKKLARIPKNYPTPKEITFEPGYDWMFLNRKDTDGDTYFVVSYDVAL